jgi:phage terminase large subunit-like protein
MAKIKGGTKGGLNDSLFRETIGDIVTPADSGKVVDIVEFARAPWGLGINLTPVQGFMIKALYGLPMDAERPYIEVPDVLNSRRLYAPMTEVEFAKWSYEEGRCNIDFSDPNNWGRDFYNFVMALGRRSGKSTLCSCVVDYEFYRLFKCGNPHKLYDVPPGQEIAVIGTAPTDGQAQIVFNMAKTFAQNSPIMRDRVAHPTQTYFELQTDADIKQFGKGREGSMQFITGGSSSNSIRGHNAIVVLIDEMAFFNETGNRFSIDEVYGALTPSIAKFTNPDTGHMDGKIICLSSPYAHFGKFYDLYRDSFSDESSKFGKTVSFRYYTALVNPGNASEEYLREEKRKDRSKFKREFEAEFDERITAWVDSEVQFRNNIKRPYQKQRGQRGVKYFYGFDFGSTDNGASISVVHKEEECYFLDYAEVFYPKNSPIWEATVCTLYKEHAECGRFKEYDVLPLFDIADYIKVIAKNFPLFTGVIDQYSGHAIYQILTSKGIENIDLKSYNESSKSRVFKLIKELYQENLLNLMDHPVLIQEMLNMEAELRPGNKISVNKRDSSDDSFQDDLTDSYVRAVWECWSYHNNIKGGSGKGHQAPIMVSFGNGRPININATSSNDITNKLRSASNLREHQRLRKQMHGVDIKRTPEKRKRP